MPNLGEFVLGEGSHKFGSKRQHFSMGARLWASFPRYHLAIYAVGPLGFRLAAISPVVGSVDCPGMPAPIVGISYEAWPDYRVYKPPRAG